MSKRTSIAWTLAKHGDSLEKKWAPKILSAFPRYEQFWADHVVPLTYRTADPHCIYLRAAVRKELDAVATASYGVFLHLAGAHAQLATDPALFAAEGVYTFYNRLYSVREMVSRFLAAIAGVLQVYGGVYIADEKRRLRVHGSATLPERFRDAFDKRTKDYRGQQVHDWGFPVINHRIPSRKALKHWTGKGLRDLDLFLKRPDAASRIAADFVDPVVQARDDLAAVEDVLNDVWQLAIAELSAMTHLQQYRHDQGSGAHDPLPSAATAESVLVTPPHSASTLYASSSSAVALGPTKS